MNANFQASSVTGAYLDQGRADVREMPLYTWHDVTSQQPGQCIVTFYGRRVYAEIPNIQLANKGYLRVPANLTRSPRPKSVSHPMNSMPSPHETARRKLLARADTIPDAERAGPRGQMLVFCTAYRQALTQGTDPDTELREVYRQLELSHKLGRGKRSA